ncbi:MAG TPA: beta-galactosidase trimerization domain-containing protein [Polyangia bacterium]|nr:beta-galactosidase trimerization domain-containing protein [Polyangia bacterium]
MSAGAVKLPPRFLLGANYWSRAGGPRMWERFDEAVVKEELRALKAAGLDSLRVFAFAPSMMPHPPALDEGRLALMARFADLAAEAGLSLFPSPLVGHMSGENYGFPGQGARNDDRSLYDDKELRAWQTALVGGVVRALAGKPAVAAWILSNEMPLWAGAVGLQSGAPPEDVIAWARAMTDVVRAADPTRPVGTGDGMMGGWPTRALAADGVVDWVGPHVYYGDVDPLRHAFGIDFQLARARACGRPVVLEEFGASSTQAGEAEHAAYVRESVLTSLAAGAQGALVWCASDFDRHTLGLETPYSHHAFELGFGLLRSDGSEKPVCEELRALRALVDAIDFPTVTRPRARVALVASDWLERSFPFSWEDKGGLKRALLQAFVLAAQAGFDADVVNEDDPLDGYALVLVPSTQKLRVPTWHTLEAAARAGATIYWSYFSGENEFHQGAWCPNFTALTGLRHRLRYGCFDLPGERLTLKGQAVLSVPTGQQHHAAPQSLARLPIEPALAGVESLAVDGDGNLAIAEHRLGAGRVVFAAHPIERYLMARPDGSARDAHRIYRLLAEEAGLEPDYETHHPDVQARVLHAGADDLVIVQHRGWTASVDDASELPREAELVYDRGNPSARAFGPKGARVWRVRGVR